MRWFIIEVVCGVSLLLAGMTVRAEERDSVRQQRREERYERRVVRYERQRENYQSAWAKLIPKYQILQYAGSIGAFSIGTGWDYGKKDQWETDFLVGIIPRFSGEETRVTLTLRENYIPWTVKLNDSWSYRPFSVSLGMNTVLDENFWVREPKRYPAPYYKFSTRIRFLAFFGQRFSVNLGADRAFKRLSFYYEVGTCDLYLISIVSNKYLKLNDILSLSFGLKFQLL